MSRINDVFLPQGSAFSRGTQAPVVDPSNGGQMGYAPDYTTWVSNQAYVRRNLICLLVEPPSAFLNLPQSDKWIGTLRSLVEQQALSITGLSQELNIETVDSNPVGGGGQVQEEFTNVTMNRSTPTFRWNERYGMPLYRFFNGWVRYCMMDPETKVASINTLAGNAVPDMLADRYTMTCAFIEPDPTHTKVVRAWLCANMFPKGNIGGNLNGQRELTAAGEIGSLDIEFSAITQYGEGVNAMAQRLLNAINITNANPYTRQAFVQNISADVLATANGYAKSVDQLAQQQATV